jgi:hypothetical protein
MSRVTQSATRLKLEKAIASAKEAAKLEMWLQLKLERAAEKTARQQEAEEVVYVSIRPPSAHISEADPEDDLTEQELARLLEGIDEPVENVVRGFESCWG